MFILESIYSDNILFTLIGNHMLIKILEMAPFRLGRKFLFKLIYSKGGQATTYLLKDSSIFTPEMCNEITETASYIISLFIDEYSIFLIEKNCFAPLQPINKFLTIIMHCYSPVLNPIINSILRILANQSLISPSDSNYFDGVIGSIVGQLCVQSAFGSSLKISDVLDMIIQLVNVKSLPDHILMNTEFIIKMMTEMGSKNCQKKFLQQSWKLFGELTKKKDHVHQIVKIDSFDKAIAPIASSEDPFLFYKFSKFIIRVAKLGDDILDETGNVLSSSIGRMACTIKNANKLFRNSPKTLNVTNEMLTCIQLTNSKFKSNISNHLTSLDMDLRRYTIMPKKKPLL